MKFKVLLRLLHLQKKKTKKKNYKFWQGKQLILSHADMAEGE